MYYKDAGAEARRGQQDNTTTNPAQLIRMSLTSLGPFPSAVTCVLDCLYQLHAFMADMHTGQ